MARNGGQRNFTVARNAQHHRHCGPIVQVYIVGLLLVAMPVHAAAVESSGRKLSCDSAFIAAPSDNRLLMALAPPARERMGAPSYGDAPFATLHYKRRRDQIQHASFKCRALFRAESTNKTYYVYSPAFLSAPQVAAGDDDRLLPRPSVLPWIVDSILNPHD